MSIRITGQPTPCCNSKCLNDPLLTWDRKFFEDSTGTFTALPGGGIRLDTAEAIYIIDSKVSIQPGGNFCFTTTVQENSGFEVLIGLIDPTITSWIVVTSAGAGWFLSWKNASGVTIKSLIASADTNKHTFKVCKVGNQVAVQVDGQTFKFTIDGNFPTTALNPAAFAEAAQLDVLSYCLEKVKK